MVSGFPRSASLGITLPGVFRGDGSPGALLLEPLALLQLHYFTPREPLMLAAGTEERRRNELLPHNVREVSAQKRREPQGCLAAFLPVSQQRTQMPNAALGVGSLKSKYMGVGRAAQVKVRNCGHFSITCSSVSKQNSLWFCG